MVRIVPLKLTFTRGVIIGNKYIRILPIKYGFSISCEFKCSDALIISFCSITIVTVSSPSDEVPVQGFCLRYRADIWNNRPLTSNITVNLIAFLESFQLKNKKMKKITKNQGNVAREIRCSERLEVH